MEDARCKCHGSKGKSSDFYARPLPAEAVGQLCAVEPERFLQLFPLGLLASRMDARVLASLAVPLPGRSLEQGGAEEEVSLAQEVPQALRLWGGLGVPLAVLDLTHRTRSTADIVTGGGGES